MSRDMKDQFCFQNHMFSELLFLRYLKVLLHHSRHLLRHLKTKHMGSGSSRHDCCYRRTKIIYDMFRQVVKINECFSRQFLF